MSVAAPGEDPLIFDLGTGVRYFGGTLDASVQRLNVLVSHLHWDHIQGLPFLPQLQCEDCEINVWAPAQDDGRSARDCFAAAIAQPVFPVALDSIGAQIAIHDVAPTEWKIGSFTVRSAEVPHIGPTLGYRVTYDDRSVVYVSDHQEPTDPKWFAPDVLDLCEAADVLIHDAQFVDADYAGREDWGHCRIDYAMSLAIAARVSTLVLFHHDPSRSDDELDAIEAEYQRRGAEAGIDVVVAREGLELTIPCHADRHA